MGRGFAKLEAASQPVAGVFDRGANSDSQDERIADRGQAECRLHGYIPVRRHGIGKHRPDIVLLACPVEAELMRVAERPEHLDAIAQALT